MRARSATWKCALRPLGFGTTQVAAPPTRSRLQPHDRLRPLEPVRQAVTPRTASTRGRYSATSSARRGGALAQLLGGELRGRAGRPGHDVGDAEPVGQQLAVLVRREQPRGEPGQVDRRPEAVAGPGEVVAALGRQQRRVDPAEQHATSRRDHVRQRLLGHGQPSMTAQPCAGPAAPGGGATAPSRRPAADRLPRGHSAACSLRRRQRHHQPLPAPTAS